MQDWTDGICGWRLTMLIQPLRCGGVKVFTIDGVTASSSVNFSTESRNRHVAGVDDE